MLPAAPPRDAEHGARLPLLFGIGALVLTALLAHTLLGPTHVDTATVRLSVGHLVAFGPVAALLPAARAARSYRLSQRVRLRIQIASTPSRQVSFLPSARLRAR